MKKHAYLIVANGNFKVLCRCMELIDDPRNDVFLLIDKKTKIAEKEIDGLKAVCMQSKVYVTRAIVNWAGYSQVEAVLRLLQAAMEKNTSYRYLHFMQGSDLPIKTQDQIHRFFTEHDGTEYVMVEKNRSNMAVNKTQYRHFLCHNRFFRNNKCVKALNFSLVYAQKQLGIRKRLDMDVYQGSALFSITDDFARCVLSQQNRIRELFRWSLAVDEVFLQSLIMDSPFRERIANGQQLVTSNARLIDRTRPDGKNSPHVWRSDEFDFIMNQPEDVCFA